MTKTKDLFLPFSEHTLVSHFSLQGQELVPVIQEQIPQNVEYLLAQAKISPLQGVNITSTEYALQEGVDVPLNFGATVYNNYTIPNTIPWGFEGVNYNSVVPSATLIALKRGMVIKGIEKDGLIPYFQKIVDDKGQVYKYETLVRARNSHGALVTPVDIFESGYTGLPEAFNDFYFACIKYHSAEISINIPFSFINSPLYFEFLKKILKYNIQHLLTFEILETDSSHGLDTELQSRLMTAKHIGIKLAIDDFGTGYSDEERVHLIKPDYIKLDGIFSMSCFDISVQEEISRVLQLAQQYGAKVIAEKVETQEQFEILKQLGVHFFQGYLFGKPEANI